SAALRLPLLRTHGRGNRRAPPARDDGPANGPPALRPVRLTPRGGDGLEPDAVGLTGGRPWRRNAAMASKTRLTELVKAFDTAGCGNTVRRSATPCCWAPSAGAASTPPRSSCARAVTRTAAARTAARRCT